MPRINLILRVFLLAITQHVLARFDKEVENIPVSAPRNEYSLYAPMESSHLKKSYVQSDQECSCTYDYENSFVKARVGKRMLEDGDIVMRGETVSFECRYVNMVLTWQNGLRFFGRAEMTCSTCDIWQRNKLPTCKSSMKIKAVLGQDADLAVSPGGIIQVRKGESRQFFCSSVWKQPQWKYLEKEGVSETKIENSGQGETIYVSYLNITNAKNEHSGIYECFTRSNTGQQIVSTFLHLQVIDTCIVPVIKNGELGTFSSKRFTGYSSEEFMEVPPGKFVNPGQTLYLRCEDGFIPLEDSLVGEDNLLKITCNEGYWTEVLQCEKSLEIPPSTGTWLENGVSPSESTTAEYWPILNDRNNSFCFCTYDFKDTHVVARLGYKILKKGDAIMQGETVSLECSLANRILKWENNLRYYGKAYMTCNICKLWSAKDIPSCPHMWENDTFISSDADLTFLPGGIVYMQEGQKYQFRCVSSWAQPQWIYEVNKEDILESRSQMTVHKEVFFFSQLDIMQAKDKHSGMYECVTEDDFRLARSNTLYLQVNAFPHPGCSVDDLRASLPENVDADITIEKDQFMRSGSEVDLKCPNSPIFLGNAKALCMEDGKWQLDILECISSCRLNIDPSSGLLVQPMKDVYNIGELVTLFCGVNYKLSRKVERMMCLYSGWSDDLPKCIETK